MSFADFLRPEPPPFPENLPMSAVTYTGPSTPFVGRCSGEHRTRSPPDCDILCGTYRVLFRQLHFRGSSGSDTGVSSLGLGDRPRDSPPRNLWPSSGRVSFGERLQFKR